MRWAPKHSGLLIPSFCNPSQSANPVWAQFHVSISSQIISSTSEQRVYNQVKVTQALR